MRRKVFVNYRRTDAEATAGRIADRLRTSLGADSVFFDTLSIQPSELFPERLRNEPAVARAVLVDHSDTRFGRKARIVPSS